MGEPVAIYLRATQVPYPYILIFEPVPTEDHAMGSGVTFIGQDTRVRYGY